MEDIQVLRTFDITCSRLLKVTRTNFLEHVMASGSQQVLFLPFKALVWCRDARITEGCHLNRYPPNRSKLVSFDRTAQNSSIQGFLLDFLATVRFLGFCALLQYSPEACISKPVYCIAKKRIDHH